MWESEVKNTRKRTFVARNVLFGRLPDDLYINHFQLEKLGIELGAGIPQLQTVGTLTVDQLREIAEIKMPDLNANTIEAAMEIIAGTARSMGVRIEGRETH